MARKPLRLWNICLLCVFVALPWAVARAQSDEAFIAYRQKVMDSQAASMGAIGDIVKNKLPYQTHIAIHAKDIHQMSTLIGEAFKKEVAAGATDAKAEIWRDWERFTTAADALGQQSAALAEIAASGDLSAVVAQVKKVGDACGGCHQPFRKPKEESYKKQ